MIHIRDPVFYESKDDQLVNSQPFWANQQNMTRYIDTKDQFMIQILCQSAFQTLISFMAICENIVS